MPKKIETEFNLDMFNPEANALLYIQAMGRVLNYAAEDINLAKYNHLFTPIRDAIIVAYDEIKTIQNEKGQ